MPTKQYNLKKDLRAPWPQSSHISTFCVRITTEMKIVKRANLALAEKEYVRFCGNCALGDKFLKFGTVLGMGLGISETTASHWGIP